MTLAPRAIIRGITDYSFWQGKQGEKNPQIEKAVVRGGHRRCAFSERQRRSEADRRINSQQSVIRGHRRGHATLSSFVLKGAAPQTSST